MRDEIEDAKRRLPLPQLMRRRGLGDHARRSEKCPFHDDQHNSFSIWQTDKGFWFWKCHAGCGAGDEITLLEKLDGVSNKEAIKLFLEVAGVAQMSREIPGQKSNSEIANPIDWRRCVDALTEKHLKRLGEWRGYSDDFCSWLYKAGLVGLWQNCIAFPVHDRAGQVVSVHYWQKDTEKWYYHPNGVKVRPLVISELLAGEPVHVFESQWDGFAFMDISGERSGVVATRGASNGALVAGLISESSTAYVWTQNDAAGEKWQSDVRANTKAVMKRAKIPAPHKDLNDWTRAGALAGDLVAAMVNAEVIRRAGTSSGESTKLPEITQTQPFPLHCLGDAPSAMAHAVCETARVPGSLPGCCALGMLSGAVGAGLQVQSGPNRVTRGNLYILASAESCSGKSEAFRHVAKPFLQFEVERLKVWRAETKAGLLAERDILESEIAKLKKLAGDTDGALERDEIRSQLEKKKAALEETETKLRAPVLSCEDITSQKLAELLAHNGEQLASLSADAGEIVNILLGRYNKLDRTDESVYLKAFTGDYCKVDRKNSEPVLLQSPCLAALWLTQPDKLESLLAERSLSDGGLIPRILACHTNCEPREIEEAPAIAASVSKAFDALIRDLLETYRLASESRTIHPVGEALQALNAHHDALVKRRRSELRDVTSFAGRWTEQAWRIAVCLHAALHGGAAHDHRLELETAQRAITLADWFAVQQLEILSASRYKARRKVWDEVLSLLADKPQGIRSSDLYRSRIVRNADEAHALLASMESEGELSGCDEQPEGGGHITRIFTRAEK